MLHVRNIYLVFYHRFDPNVGKYSIHGTSGFLDSKGFFNLRHDSKKSPSTPRFWWFDLWTGWRMVERWWGKFLGMEFFVVLQKVGILMASQTTPPGHVSPQNKGLIRPLIRPYFWGGSLGGDWLTSQYIHPWEEQILWGLRKNPGNCLWVNSIYSFMWKEPDLNLHHPVLQYYAELVMSIAGIAGSMVEKSSVAVFTQDRFFLPIGWSCAIFAGLKLRRWHPFFKS